ncbi:hypothetical protein B2J93_6550 [Marssonina coronariae]|uniref:Transcription factor CBF/NF-Y/archaeal histone domain-containing protein n=1 Tax=Diplocarpon coronariae TaxID=2795749 RepID=A0A218Z0G4_9HELO|nr:hypothetical protein B2J93_6550 [Marssonina coronariae]
MDSTYAPQSPDLSSFHPAPTKTKSPQSSRNRNALTAQPDPLSRPDTRTSTSCAYAPRLSALLPSTAPGHREQASRSALTQNQQHNHLPLDGTSDFPVPPAAQYLPPVPDLPMNHSFSNPNQIPNPEQSPLNAQYFQRPPRQARNNIPSYNEDRDYEPEPEYIAAPPHPLPTASMLTSGPRSKASSSAALPPSYKDPNPLNIEIKTKFPVARIKRIMQADEEVGKVAQVTPVAVSKALELFMIALVGGAADKAREKGGKKVTSQHLKAVVLGAPEQFDFLAEIVARVGDAQEGAGGEGRKRKEAKDGSESSEEEKKVKKGRGRKKKSED